jgi:hypothetical protein
MKTCGECKWWRQIDTTDEGSCYAAIPVWVDYGPPGANFHDRHSHGAEYCECFEAKGEEQKP